MQEFDIEYKGSKGKVKYITELNFGDIETVLNNSVSFKLGGDISVNFPTYRMTILLKAIKEAPFPITPNGINDLPYKTAQILTKEILKYFPLETYLVEWVATLNGGVQKEEEETSQ